MTKLEDLLKENNKLLKEQNTIMKDYSDCRLADEPEERWWNKWEYRAAMVGLALSALFVYSNFYSMNGVHVSSVLSNLLNNGPTLGQDKELINISILILLIYIWFNITKRTIFTFLNRHQIRNRFNSFLIKWRFELFVSINLILILLFISVNYIY
jgi:hypothetical protein